MATTTNYGWTTPDDTALVKDGASAIRTLGSSVDTTTKNLNPETTLGDLSFRSSTSNVNTRIGIGSSGQFLSVVGGVPAWATATDQTPLTTKGDIFTFSTVDARLAVGTNGQVLTADSSEATGLKFATPAAGGGMTLLASGDLSGSVVNLTSISGNYKDLIITLANIDLADGARAVYIKVNDTNIVGMSNIYSTSLGAGANNSFIYVASSDSAYYMSTDADNAFSFRISNYADTNQKKAIFGAGGYRYIGDAPIRGYLFYGATENSNAITELNITAVSTTFSAGKYKLYGVS